MNDNANAHALLGVYLVDALSAHERDEFEAHLATCEDCQSEVQSLRGVLAVMADAEATSPPAGMRAKVLAQADRTAQLPPLLTQQGRGRSRRLPLTRVLTAAAAVVALAVVSIGVLMASGGDSDAVAMEREVMMVASAPDAASMDLELGASHLVISKRMEAAATMGYGAPMPTKGMEYQLWLVMDDGSAHPGPTFMPTDDGDFMTMMHTSFAGVSGFWVTEEPMGGSDAPTGELLATVEI
jgi:anti-sigma-K factor RskA